MNEKENIIAFWFVIRYNRAKQIAGSIGDGSGYGVNCEVKTRKFDALIIKKLLV